MAGARLKALASNLTSSVTGPGAQDANSIPWNPDSSSFPARSQLPQTAGSIPGAAWVWGADDQLGRLNLLTAARTLAAKEAIVSGDVVPVNLPLHLPSPPAFGRERFTHRIKTLADGIAYDDVWECNTQSGTQWDGFRHFGDVATQTFYNGTKSSDFAAGSDNLKGSVHHWAEHGIAGRGLLIDFGRWAAEHLPSYAPFSTAQPITLAQVQAAGAAQGINVAPAAQGGDVRPGDMLFLRTGWTAAYLALGEAERRDIAGVQHPTFNGLQQSDAVLDWLHDCYFATVAADSPTLEAWPRAEQPDGKAAYHLHEFILARWGMPLGEMLDLERLAALCKEKNRYFFFFTSAPANVRGGVATHVNGTAIL